MLSPDTRRLLAFAAAGASGGLLAGDIALGVAVALAAHAVVQLRALRALERWVRQPRRHPEPTLDGAVAEVCVEVCRLRARHRRRKQRLAAYIKRFQEATAALPDATAVLADDERIEWANPAARSMLGIRWPQDAGQRLTNLVRASALAEALASGEGAVHVELPAPGQRDRWLDVRIVPYGNDQRLLVARDVTDLHRVERMRRDFVANVSHELRTPLTVLEGYLGELARRADEAPAAWRAPLAQMQAQSRRMARIVDDLLMLAALEADDDAAGRTVAVAPMLAELHAEAQALSGDARHILLFDVDPTLCLHGRRDELYSAFANLVFNAVRYTPERGVIRVRWFADDEGAHFEVQDNGIGIAPEHLPRLTERFYRVDRSRSRASGGTGLGLAIVKHVLQRHDGRLHVDSAPGEGSTFRCDFPASRIRRQTEAGARDEQRA